MTNTPALTKSLLIYGMVIPVALLLGYALSTPTDLSSAGVILLIFALLSIPCVLHWHHPILVLSWNASLTLGFVHSELKFWMVMGCISGVFTILARIMNKEGEKFHVPMITSTLLLFAGVVLAISILRGGVGIRAIGSASYGGKGYILIAFAVIGYFALSAKRIPPSKAYLYVGLFFFGAVTSAFSNFAYSAGESFWWLFYFLPVDLAISQAAADFGLGLFSRFGGAAWAMIGVYCYMLAKHGIRGIFSFQHPFRFALWLLTILMSLLGGFRSILVLYVVLFAVQFYLEGLFRTRLFPVLVLVCTLGFVLLIPMASRLPLVMQRTLSLLPLIDVDPVARADAYASTDWRLRMWRAAWPQVSHYFIIGKGFVIDPVEMTMVEEGWKRGFVEDYEASFVSGDYHSGPLSLLIPLGIFGALAFIAFTVACLVVLYRNFRFGDPRLKSINTLLLSLFITRLFLYWVVFGSVTTGLSIFTGLIGLSVALNGGMAEEPQPSRSPSPIPA